MTNIIIEVRGGTVVFIGSNTQAVKITLIDHDWPEGPGKEELTPDSIMTDEGIEEYIEKA